MPFASQSQAKRHCWTPCGSVLTKNHAPFTHQDISEGREFPNNWLIVSALLCSEQICRNWRSWIICFAPQGVIQSAQQLAAAFWEDILGFG